MSNSQFYSKKVMEYFLKPRNYGRIENADAIGKVGDPSCGDVMWLYLKIKEENGKYVIEEAKFETFGCAAAIASSSVATEIIKGKTIEEALKVSNKDILKELGGLPLIKVHCSLLAEDAIKEAIYNFMKKKGLQIPEELEKRHEKIKARLDKTLEMHKKLGYVTGEN